MSESGVEYSNRRYGDVGISCRRGGCRRDIEIEGGTDSGQHEGESQGYKWNAVSHMHIVTESAIDLGADIRSSQSMIC